MAQMTLRNLLLLLMLITLTFGSGWDSMAKPSENNAASYEEVLSEFIYRMFLFVRWPDHTFNDVDSPVRIVFYGANNLADKAHEIIGNRKVGNRHIVVEKARYLEDILGCHAIFIGYEKSGELSRVLDAFSDKAILTMGDSNGFSEKGVIFNFFTDQERIRFKSNVLAADRAGLGISSELLKLSVIVGDNPHAK